MALGVYNCWRIVLSRSTEASGIIATPGRGIPLVHLGYPRAGYDEMIYVEEAIAQEHNQRFAKTIKSHEEGRWNTPRENG